MKKQKFYWALGVFVMFLIIWFCYRGGQLALDPEQTAEGPAGTEQVDVQPTLKAPPPGETFATGHWEGDEWRRTAPPEPATVMHEGKAMTLAELYRSAHLGTKPWAEKVPIFNRIIAEAPYSEEAYYARRDLAEHDENGETIWDDAVLFERLQPLVAYHPNYPRLLKLLLQKGWDIYPEAAIHYGKEALKYVDMYPIGRGHGAFPEDIHDNLGDAYQQIGDYSSALAHHQKALELIRAYPGRTRTLDYAELVQRSIDAILSGNPHHGPLAQEEDSEDVDSVPVVDPVGSEAVSAPRPLPSIEPGAPLSDVLEDEDDVSGESPNDGVDPRAVARQQAQQRYEQVKQKAQQEQQRFESFMKQLHQIATIKTEADFEKFLMQELVNQLRAPDTAQDKKPSVSADRMRRAAQIFRKSKTPAEGMKALQEVDPDLANTLHRLCR